METVIFRSYKIEAKLPLEKIEVFFKIQRALKWNEYIVLDEHELNFIFRFNSVSKLVYIFRYGCISFMNFEEDEVYTFLHHIKSVIGNVDFSLFSKYNESHMLQIDGNGICKLWKSSDETLVYKNFYNHIISIVLAKSTELFKLEIEVGDLLDQADKFLIYLQKGSLNINKKVYTASIAKVLRLEYHIINNIKIFERDIFNNESIESRRVYDKLSEYYELDSRCKVIQSKIDDLRGIYKAYSSLSYRQIETRLYWLEIFMLALFPFSYFIHNSQVKESIASFFRGLF